jgi:phospholipid transport system substrate-binding protein
MFHTHRRTGRISIVILACLFPVLFPLHVRGSETGPLDQVRDILNQVMAIQTDPKTAGSAHREERKKAIKTVILKNFDMDRMAEDALGDYWQKLANYQKAEFAAVFRDLFQDSYTRLVLDFLKQERIGYSPEEPKDGEALVKTVILRPNENIPVGYLLERMNGRWLVHDVIIDGVSIIRKYRSSFTRVIMKTSYSVLLEKMRLQQKAIHENPD